MLKMILTTRGKKFEFFEVDEFISFLEDNNYNFTKKEAIEYFTKHNISTVQLSKLPFKKQSSLEANYRAPKTINEAPKKSKTEIFIENSGCPNKTAEYFNNLKMLIKSFENPPQRFLEKTLYYVYLPDFEYYALVIQNDFNYFKNFQYRIIDKYTDFYFKLFYIKLSILKKHFDDRKILKIGNGSSLCFFEGFDKKVIDFLPEEPLEKIDYMEKFL
jgi:hypothetical protein